MIFDVDNQEISSERGAIPRTSVYGSAPGLIPLGAAHPDLLVDPSDYKGVTEWAHSREVFPMYHQQSSWAPGGTVWNQNGLNYCWTWSITAALMDLRSREGKDTVLLSPVSLGWTVGWRNNGNYLESGIAGLRERGVCEMSYTPDEHSRDPNSFKNDWDVNSIQYRLDEVWDCDNRSKATMIQHAITVLKTGTPLYVAYNWWGHAVECVGVRWDESQVNNLVWLIRNSHGEDELLQLAGHRAVPDEAYGLRSSLTV